MIDTLIRWSLHHRAAIIAMALVVASVAAMLFAYLGMRFAAFRQRGN